MATIITKARKEKMDLLVKLDKADTENHWDYERACEYRNMKQAKRCAKIESIIEKKCNSIWEQLCKSFKVERRWDLPKEITDYVEEGINNNKYDRFNNYERDLERLGVKLPKRA